MPRKKRTSKPYRDFPLTLHPTGQWCKKIKGKLYYFGKDADAALKRYLDEKDDRQAGRDPGRKTDGLTLRELVNRFLDSKKALIPAELSPITWRNYYDVCERLLAIIGKDCRVLDLNPADFERLRGELSKGRGAQALATQIQKIRTIFKYAFDNELIDRPVRMGKDGFKKPGKKAFRQARNAAGSRMIEAEELRSLLDAAKGQMKPMILLAINCGFGQTDVANLPLSAIDFKTGYVTFPRPKTAVMRRCPLWPETLAAIKEAVVVQPTPSDPADAGLVFITKYGKRWVRGRDRESGGVVVIDSVNLEFNKLLVKLGLKRNGGFYNLRHVFRTVADGAKDQPAANHIMGHVDESMSDQYRERIDDARLLAVVNVVRSWLWLEVK